VLLLILFNQSGLFGYEPRYSRLGPPFSVVSRALKVWIDVVVTTLVKKKTMPGDPGVTPGATPANRPANPSGSQDGRPNGTQDQRRRQGGHRGGQRDQQPPRVPKFEGKCPELAGHIYDYSNARQAADKYTKTTREICEYVGRTYKFGADTKVALQTLKKPVFQDPPDPRHAYTDTQVGKARGRTREKGNVLGIKFDECLLHHLWTVQ
jgi:hypothetical protein